MKGGMPTLRVQQEEDSLTAYLKSLKKKKEDKKVAKRKARKPTQAQIKLDLVYKLRGGNIKTAKLKETSIEALPRMWDRDTFTNPGARKREEEEEEEEEKKAEEEARKAQEENLRKEMEDLERFVALSRKKNEEMKKMTADLSDLDRDEKVLNQLVMVKPDGIENTEPIGEDHSDIVNWYGVAHNNGKIWIERENGMVTSHRSIEKILKSINKVDVHAMYEIGKKNNIDKKQSEMSYEKIVWGWIKMIFEPELYAKVFMSSEPVRSWRYFSRAEVHQVILVPGDEIFMLAGREYVLSLNMMKNMVEKKMTASINNEKTRDSVYKIMNQIHKLERIGHKK